MTVTRVAEFPNYRFSPGSRIPYLNFRILQIQKAALKGRSPHRGRDARSRRGRRQARSMRRTAIPLLEAGGARRTGDALPSESGARGTSGEEAAIPLARRRRRPCTGRRRNEGCAARPRGGGVGRLVRWDSMWTQETGTLIFEGLTGSQMLTESPGTPRRSWRRSWRKLVMPWRE